MSGSCILAPLTRPQSVCTGQQHFLKVGKCELVAVAQVQLSRWSRTGEPTTLLPRLRSYLPRMEARRYAKPASGHNQRSLLTAASATQHEDITTSVGTQPAAETDRCHPATSPDPMRTSRSEQNTHNTFSHPVRARRQDLFDPHRPGLQPTYVQISHVGGLVLPHIRPAQGNRSRTSTVPPLPHSVEE